MTKTRAELTELEGAILSVVRFAPGSTAYRVRLVFLTSRSAEWSGSAGAVYPAITRLEALRLVRASAETDKRGTRSYRITRSGEGVHDRWLSDVERALSPGIDPFRTRAGFWSALPRAKRISLMKHLRQRVVDLRAELLREQDTLDPGDKIMAGLHIDVQDLRLRWLDRYLKALNRKLR